MTLPGTLGDDWDMKVEGFVLRAGPIETSCRVLWLVRGAPYRGASILRRSGDQASKPRSERRRRHLPYSGIGTVLAPIGIGLHWWRSGHILATLILVWGLLIAGAIAQDRRRHVLAGNSDRGRLAVLGDLELVARQLLSGPTLRTVPVSRPVAGSAWLRPGLAVCAPRCRMLRGTQSSPGACCRSGGGKLGTQPAKKEGGSVPAE